ncbi:Peroxidase [Bertholletia excelsa]
MATVSRSRLHVSAILYVFMIFLSSNVASSPLRVGYYRKTCPSAEAIIRKAVKKAVSKNPGIAAGLVRMHFHDCFGRGCDGSVLLDSVAGKPAAEKAHPANNPSLRGFEVIDEAKAQLEAVCPRTVSCADIVAFAAHDSAFKAGGINYAVPAGRRDGRVSLSDEVSQNLPRPSFSAKQLEDNFARKRLSRDDMVTLSGAHSTGVSHCSSFSNRLYSNSTLQQDLSMDPSYAVFWKTKCPPPAASNVKDLTVPLEVTTPNRLDNRYYSEIKSHRGLLTSDQTLLSSPSTAKLVMRNAKYGSKWAAKFASAMVPMGSIDVLTGSKGEIRKNCHFVN